MKNMSRYRDNLKKSAKFRILHSHQILVLKLISIGHRAMGIQIKEVALSDTQINTIVFMPHVQFTRKYLWQVN